MAAINLQGLAIRDHVANELAEIFEDSGELLPFYVGDDNWYFYNVTRKIEGILDVEMSTFMLPSLNIGLQKAIFKKKNYLSIAVYLKCQKIDLKVHIFLILVKMIKMFL
ncbi:hypothetical protein [Pseudoalteromonas sp. B62]|uniref:hypothetical protein n=1 Tax=Pseudoalteromonas sp. B62 TaxID=630483 RepID=UPI00301C8533